jgi:hypothetical protein
MVQRRIRSPDRRDEDLGVSTSHVSLDGADYTIAAGIFRYSPRESFQGFFIDGRGGIHHVGAAGESGNAFGIGTEIGYDWVLGARQKMSSICRSPHRDRRWHTSSRQRQPARRGTTPARYIVSANIAALWRSVSHVEQG